MPRRLAAVSLSVAAAATGACLALLVVTFGALAFVAVVGLRWPDRVATALPMILVAVAAADGLLTQWIARPTRFDVDPRSVASLRQLEAEHRNQVDLTGQGLERWDLYTPETSALNGFNLVVKHPTFEYVLPLGNRLHLTLGSAPQLSRTAVGAERVFFAAEAVETVPSMPALGELRGATVNGDPSEVWGANVVFGAVRVESGHNTVRFLYRPPLLAFLLVVGWGGLAAGLLTALAAAIRTRGGRTSEPGNGATGHGVRG